MSGTFKTVLIIIFVLIAIGLVGGIISSIITKDKGESVKVRITDLDNYFDAQEIKKHMVYGVIISEGGSEGKKISFSTAFDNNYEVGDIVTGKYYKGNFVVDKE